MSKRAMVLATLFAAAAAAVVPAAPASARGCFQDHYCYTTFYSDSTLTVVVGEKFEDCDGRTSMWGVRSPYPTFSEIPC